MSELPQVSPKRKPEEHKQACIALVCAAYDAWAKGCPLEVSLSQGEYKRMRQYTPSFYRFRVVPPMVRLLETHGYFLLNRGYRDKKTQEGHYTKVYCTEKLIALFLFKYQASFKEVLQLKEEYFREVIDSKTKKKKTVKSSRLIEYRDNAFTRDKRQFILEWNHFT